MATPRLQALQTLAGQLPVANQRVAQGIQAARDIQLQQAVAKAPPTAAIAPAAQQTAAAATQQTGQQQTQAAQQMVEQAGKQAQLALGQQQLAAQAQIGQAQQAARGEEMDSAERLGKLDLSAKKELYDNQLKFQKDEAGRTLFNQRQLADYARQNAVSDEQYKNYAQEADQLSKRKLQAMETAYRLLTEELQQKWAIAEQAKDQKTKQQIAVIQQEIERKMAKERARAANNASMWQSGGMIAGAAAGAVFGGPTGAVVGGQLGSAAGGMIASQQE